MPIFDEALIICEQHFHDLLPLFKDAKIFVFEGVIGTQFSRNYQWEEFFLPYPVVATIIDQQSLIILSDTVENQVGISEKRRFTMFFALPDSPGQKTYAVIDGRFRRPKGQHQAEMWIDTFAGATKTFVLKTYEGSDLDMLAQDPGNEILREIQAMTENVYVAMNLLMDVNTPENFILEKSPAKQQRTGKKIPRSHQRPEYTLLSPKRIREEMRLPPVPAGTRASPRPHDVRKHEKWLSAKRYRFDRRGMPIESKVIPRGPRKGEMYYKHQIIEAHWSGPSENRVGNKIYRVILNR